jgi:redox-sensitive bicupin YhaK (pirin superfamily)
MMTLWKSGERGLSDLGWLKSRHSFSFGEYFDEARMGFGDLRVINEDRIQGGTGFSTHGHRDMEIISYVLKGALDHKDSMGTAATILPGEVQRMSAGMGVRHSEHNHLKDGETHFFQIWILPDADNLKPGYAQKDFSKQLEQGKLFLAASKDGREGSITLNQDANLYLARPGAGEKLDLPLHWDRKGWLQLASGELTVNGQKLAEGDGMAISEESAVKVQAVEDSHFLYFNLPG